MFKVVSQNLRVDRMTIMLVLWEKEHLMMASQSNECVKREISKILLFNVIMYFKSCQPIAKVPEVCFKPVCALILKFYWFVSDKILLQIVSYF